MEQSGAGAFCLSYVPHLSSRICSRPFPTVGHENIYISIYESNSQDTTPSLLHTFSTHLTNISIPHRIITDRTSTRHWPHKASDARIAYLAAARNAALEPLASSDPTIRLPDAQGWHEAKVLFLNDVVFDWESVVDLLETRLPDGEDDGETSDHTGTAARNTSLSDSEQSEQNSTHASTRQGYDLACAMDFGWSGTSLSAPYLPKR